ncbi:putative uncharacterized protein FLJ44672, partial [Homo sapiens]
SAASAGPELDFHSASAGLASCLPKACTGPSSASQRTLHAQLALACGLPSPKLRPLRRFGRPSSRLPVASSGPWGSFLTTAFPGPVFPFRRPLRAQKLLKSASPDPLVASRRPLRAQLFLPAASAGPTPASQQPLWTQCLPSSWWPWSAHSFLKPSSPGPAQASRWPLQAQLLPSDGVSKPQMASGRWASPGPGWASRRPLQAQVVLKSASPGPAPASQQASSFGSAPAQLPPAFVDPELSPAKLLSPTSCLPVACTGPGLAGEQPLQAPLLPPRGVSRPSSGLTAASRDQVPACLPAACVRPSSSVTVAC